MHLTVRKQCHINITIISDISGFLFIDNMEPDLFFFFFKITENYPVKKVQSVKPGN